MTRPAGESLKIEISQQCFRAPEKKIMFILHAFMVVDELAPRGAGGGAGGTPI